MFEFVAHAEDVVDEGLFDHMMDGGHWSSDGGFTVLWMFIVMIAIAAGVMFLVAYSGKENSPKENNDPLKTAQSRYAKGEISKKQFDEIKKDIS